MKFTHAIEASRFSGDTAAVSLEMFVPESAESALLLRQRIDRLATQTEPLFLEICGGEIGPLVESSLTPPSWSTAITLAIYAQKYSGIPSSVRITVSPSRTTIEGLARFLDQARSGSVRNVILDRGLYNGHSGEISPQEGVNCILHIADAVRFVRERHGDFFCVGVAAYPSGFGEYGSADEDLVRLKDKEIAGADFILAQHVLEAEHFFNLRRRAEDAGITIPIIPSVLPWHEKENFMQINNYCGIPIPSKLSSELEGSVSSASPSELALIGLRHNVLLCRDLLAGGTGARIIHLMSMNSEAAIHSLLRELGLTGPEAASRRKLPWRQSADISRSQEEMRPIFWANRPAAYVERTSHWTEFPSGRWKAPAWGDVSMSTQIIDKLIATTPSAITSSSVSISSHSPPVSEFGTPEQRRAMWGANPSNEKNIWQIFAGYMRGTVSRLPWCGQEMLPETGTISGPLERLNGLGFLTINSQPPCNAAKSDDPTFGWGGPGGMVFQKAYVEFFCSKAHLAALMEAVERTKSESKNQLSYTAINASGLTYSSRRLDCAMTLTWGVFPDREVLQPTIVDHSSFKAWKTEAFSLWLQEWAIIYEEDSEAYDLLHCIHDEYFLVNVVDNDFVGGDLFRVFDSALKILEDSSAELDPKKVAQTLKNLFIDGKNC